MVLSPFAAQAADFPTRRIEVVVPWEAGSSVDIASRYVARDMASQLGVPVTVENRPGAASMVGTAAVANGAADGYTVMMTGAPMFVNMTLHKDEVKYDVVRDFTPVARFSATALALVVAENSPFKTVQDLVDYAKANPGKVKYGASSVGSISYMSAVLLQSLTGAEFTLVPYGSNGAALVDTLNGTISFTFASIPTAFAQLEAKQVRALGVTGPERSLKLPDVPTLAEAGIAGYQMTTWAGAFVPKKTPPEVVEKLSASMMAATATEQFKEFLMQQGMEPYALTGAEWEASIPAEIEQWGKLVGSTSK